MNLAFFLLKKIADEESTEPVFRIRERCDRYFDVELTKDELIALSLELSSIAHELTANDK